MSDGKNLNRVLQVAWWLISSGILLSIGLLDTYDRGVLLNTFALGMSASLIAIPLGYGLAWTCLGSGRLARVMLGCTVALLVLPIFVQVSAWDAALGRLGWLTSDAGLGGLWSDQRVTDRGFRPWLSGWQAAAWIHGLAATPQVALILLIGLADGRRSDVEPARLDANRWQIGWHITLPQMLPLLSLAFLWIMVTCAREITVTDLYQIGTLAEQVYLGYSLGQFNAIAGKWSLADLQAAAQWNVGLAIAIIGWMVITAAWVIVRFVAWEQESEHRLQAASLRGNGTNWRRGSSGKRVLSLALIVLLVMVPLGNLLVRCCYGVKLVEGTPTPHYSLNQMQDVLQRAFTNYTTEFTWSILIASVASSLILVVATVLVWQSRRPGFRRAAGHWGWNQMLIGGVVALSCALPGPLVGTGLAKLLGSIDQPWAIWLYDRTIAGPVLASAWYCLPLPVLMAWFIIKSVPQDMLEHAQLEGSSSIHLLGRFVIWDHWPQWVGVWLLTFCFCIGELSAAQLVIPPGIDTLPRLMLGLLHAGVDEMTSALTIVLVILLGGATMIACCNSSTLVHLIFRRFERE